MKWDEQPKCLWKRYKVFIIRKYVTFASSSKSITFHETSIVI